MIFEISIKGSDEDDRILELTGKEKIIYFKDSVVRTEQKTKMGTVITIDNFKTKERYSYSERDDDKVAMKMSVNDMNIVLDMSFAHLPDFELTKETKRIAGYKCKKAIITINAYGEHKDLVIWFTEDIALPNAPEYNIKGIKGYIMEMVFSTDERPMTIKCVWVDATPLPDHLFSVPSDYTIKSMPDLMKPAGKVGN